MEQYGMSSVSPAMPADPEDDMTTLTMMFGEQGWDVDTLRAIYENNTRVLQNAVDEILAAGSPENWLIQRVGVGPASQVEAPKASKWKLVSVVAPPHSKPGGVVQIADGGFSYVVEIPAGAKPGKRFQARVPDYSPPLREANDEVVENPLLSA